MEIIKLKFIPNDLLEAQECCEEHIQEFVEGKTEDANIPERAEAEIEHLQDDVIQKIKEMLNQLDDDIDSIIYEFSEENLKAIKSDMKAQDKKEADLWN